MQEPSFSYADDNDPWLKRSLIRLVESATGQARLERMYLENRREMAPGESFWASAMRKLAIDMQYDSCKLESAPREGPLLFVSTHPFGVLDGIALCSLVEKVRPDFRVLTNAVLLKAPEIRDFVLPIDLSGDPASRAMNARSRVQAREYLEQGGALVLFPSGVVSTSPDRLGLRPAVDPPWQPFVARMVHGAKSPVMPVHFPGQNSRLFQIASHISQTVRLALLFHEIRRRIGTALPIRFGDVIAYEELAGLRDRKALVNELRRRSEALAG